MGVLGIDANESNMRYETKSEIKDDFRFLD